MDKAIEKNGAKETVLDLYAGSGLTSFDEEIVHNLYGDFDLLEKPIKEFYGPKMKNSQPLTVRHRDFSFFNPIPTIYNNFGLFQQTEIMQLKKEVREETKHKNDTSIIKLLTEDEVPKHEQDRVEESMNKIVLESIKNTKISKNLVDERVQHLPLKKFGCYRNAITLMRSKCLTEKAMAYKQYNNLVKYGYDPENIIVISANNVAFARRNPLPGLIAYAYTNEEFSADSPVNQYENVPIDYAGWAIEKNGAKETVLDLYSGSGLTSLDEEVVHNLYGDFDLIVKPIKEFYGRKMKNSQPLTVRHRDFSFYNPIPTVYNNFGLFQQTEIMQLKKEVREETKHKNDTSIIKLLTEDEVSKQEQDRVEKRMNKIVMESIKNTKISKNVVNERVHHLPLKKFGCYRNAITSVRSKCLTKKAMAYKQYNDLVKNGYDPENIIVISPDVVAYNPKNPMPGLVAYAHTKGEFSADSPVNQYEDVRIDYTGAAIEKNGAKETVFDLYAGSGLTSFDEEIVHNLYGDYDLLEKPIKEFYGLKMKNSQPLTPTEIMQLKRKVREETKHKHKTSILKFLTEDEVPKEEQDRVEENMNKIVLESIKNTKISKKIVNERVQQLPMKKFDCYRNAVEKMRSKCLTKKSHYLFLKYASKFAKLCSLNVPEGKILSAIESAC
ncbi:hypothetical protein V9T40_006474 [Parthenolecanium corni]|uniref:Legumain prodomain domain-containing protein n=1 Tax=Parthenolecanium corni TaxID=536013 RepID=A0AAN9TZG2_9HEMI